jgi:Ser/Thr protein kinase RdoA (MazF antagonist)
LLPGDDRIVARDPWIPGLAIVLDDERLTDHIRRHWCPDGPPPDRATVRYLRYKPGTQIVADLVLSWRSRDEHALLVATASGAAAKLHKQRRYAGDEQQPILVEDAERLLLVVPSQADRHLPGCHRLHDRLGWLDRSLRGCDVRVLAYKPHRRLVARIEDGGTPLGLLKVHHRGVAARAIVALRWAEEQRSARVRLPALRGVDEQAGVVLTDWTPGVALDEQEPDRQRATLRAVGKQLGRMHQLEGGRLTERAARPDPAAIIQAIVRLRPELAVHAERTRRASPADTALVPIHGDLSPDQVVHGDDGVVLIDLDRTGLGLAAADLASWIAATLVTADPSTSSAELPDALLAGYESVGGPATLDEVMDHLPEQLLRRAGEPFRLRHPDWWERMEALVLRAERLGSPATAT